MSTHRPPPRTAADYAAASALFHLHRAPLNFATTRTALFPAAKAPLSPTPHHADILAAHTLCDIAAVCARLLALKRAWDEEGDTEDDEVAAKKSKNWGKGFREFRTPERREVRFLLGEEDGGKEGEEEGEKEEGEGEKEGEGEGEKEVEGEEKGTEKAAVYPTPEWTGSEERRLQQERQMGRKEQADEKERREEKEQVVEKVKEAKKPEEVKKELVTKSGRRSKRPKRWGE